MEISNVARFFVFRQNCGYVTSFSMFYICFLFFFLTFIFLYYENTSLKDLLETTKNNIIQEKEALIMSSKDLKNCIDILENRIDSLASDYVDNDEFFKDIPYEDLKVLKNELGKQFEKTYVSYFSGNN